MKKIKLAHLLLAVVVLVGLFMRLSDIGAPSLSNDEAQAVRAAQAANGIGEPSLYAEGYGNGPISTQLIAISIRSFGFDPQNPWSARLPFALLGVASIITVFCLSRALFKDDYLALGAAAIVAFSESEIAWSRYAVGYAALIFFLTLAILYAWNAMNGNNKVAPVLSIIFFGLAYLSHELALIFLPLIAIFALWRIFHRSDAPWRVHLFAMISSLAVIAAIQFAFYPGSDLGIGATTQRYLSYILESFLLPFGAVMIVGLVLSYFSRENGKPAAFLLSTILAPLFIVLWHSRSIHTCHFLPIFTLAIPLFAYGIKSAVDLILSKMPSSIHDKIPKLATDIFVAATVVAAALPYLSTAPKDLYALDKLSLQPQYASGFEYISKAAHQNSDTYQTIISKDASLNMVFFGKPGYVLSRNMRPPTAEGMDPYDPSAMLINDAIAVDQALSSQHGFIITDLILEGARADLMTAILKNPAVKMVYTNYTDSSPREDLRFAVRVYRF